MAKWAVDNRKIEVTEALLRKCVLYCNIEMFVYLFDMINFDALGTDDTIRERNALRSFGAGEQLSRVCYVLQGIRPILQE